MHSACVQVASSKMFSTFNARSRSNFNLHSISVHGAGVDSKQQEKFFEVVKKDDNKGLQKVLKKKGVDVNFLFRFNDEAEKMTALHYGAIHGKIQVVFTLLACKQVSVDTKTPFDESTALHFSCSQHDPSLAYALAEALVRSGADVNALDHWEKTPLILAAQCGHLSVVRLLIRHGANLDHTYKIDDMPCVTSSSFADTVLQRDPSYGNNALIQVCRFHYSQIVRELILSGADVNVVNRNKSSALHAAADLYFMYENSVLHQRSEVSTGDPGIFSLLINSGIDVNARDSLGLTPLARLLLALDEIRSGRLIGEEVNCYSLIALRVAQILVRAGSCVQGMYPYRVGNKSARLLHRFVHAGEFLLRNGDRHVIEEFKKLVRMLVSTGSIVSLDDVEVVTSLNLPDLTDFVLSYFGKPLPLRCLCVVSIRAQTRVYPLEKHLRELHLPELLKKLVCLDIS